MSDLDNLKIEYLPPTPAAKAYARRVLRHLCEVRMRAYARYGFYVCNGLLAKCNTREAAEAAREVWIEEQIKDVG